MYALVAIIVLVVIGLLAIPFLMLLAAMGFRFNTDDSTRRHTTSRTVTNPFEVQSWEGNPDRSVPPVDEPK